jgi:asparagine synthase (glutamine-hydrolysing)
MTAEHFGTDHHEFVIDFNPIEIIPKVIWHMDEPIADPTSLPVYLLSQMAKKYVTVVLVGEGADECLAGYEQYKIMKMSQKLSCLPGFLKRNAFPRLVKKTPRVILDGFFKYASSLGEEGVKRSVDFISSFGDYHEDYGKINFIFTEEEKARLYGKPHNLKKSSRIFKEYFTDRKNLLNDMLMADLKTFLLHLLTKADKMAMAHGVEGRVPYLDHRIVEFSSSIPENMKLRGKNDKYILRKFSSSLLPKAIAMRKKSRFFVPIHHWFEGDLKCEMENLFSRENVRNRGYFDHGYIENLMKKYDRSRLYYGRQLWNLMVLEIWCKTFMDKERIPSSPKNLTI